MQLSDLLRSEGSLTIERASQAFAVHPMTIRRDMQALEEEGVARRVRGGVVLVGPDDFRRRQGRNLGAKRKIAEKLVPLVKGLSAVGLDASSTIYQLACEIRDVENLTVLTNGLAAFDTLQFRPGLRVYLTGGELEERTNSLTGPLATAAISSFVLDACFVSTSSLDPMIGSSELTMGEVEVKRAMATAARRVVLAADSSKLTSKAMARSLPMDRVDVLVTELDPDDNRLDPFRGSLELL
ncbi:DeoR family fructose operon transcriptional repressor [Microbacterium sp. AK009]|uniref:DeoR/GlpR family DNA-binding transcription regulator n=1 Tax=Microbacterium sp. AK009 TaxID=2723068 RepID=UPI0018226ABA|nr:DeoR/GlpR family DNA-binding transcription regulator [Microbacterium sp. AK009]NYF16612.1 DeoR family fructose operon transcriptional repressor [Microbacterium sp. AK009]